MIIRLDHHKNCKMSWRNLIPYCRRFQNGDLFNIGFLKWTLVIDKSSVWRKYKIKNGRIVRRKGK